MMINVWSVESGLPSRLPSRLGWVHGPGHGLSADGLSGVQLSKEGGRGGCLVLTPYAWQTLSVKC